MAADEPAPDSLSGEPLLETGTLLENKYRILRPIGAGGMANVYLAEHLELDAPVAVKVMRLNAGRGIGRRFEREARATLALNHPNIVRVMDFGRVPAPFIVMEYIDGKTLGELLDQVKAPYPLATVRGLLRQILEALASAHDAGVVHRDLKPDNVLLTRLDQALPFVKVVDFGLARFDAAKGESTLTQQGLIAGTPAYMSPEQCRSMHVGPASDLYAIGCILTELLQLSPPFAAESAAVLMSHQMFTPPGPLLRPADAETVPPALEELRLQLLSKRVHQRPATAHEVLERLERTFEPELRESERPSRSPSIGRGSFPSAPPKTGDAETARLRVQLVGGTESGVSEDCRAGLAVHGVELVSANSAGGGAPIVVLDRRAHLSELCTLVEQLVSGGQAVIVCIAEPHVTTLQRLLEAGATDTATYPIEAHALAKKIRRAQRRLG